jgi:hypothetical protein
MSSKRPGIKHSKVTKLLRQVGELVETEQGQEQEQLATHHLHGWHHSFATLTSPLTSPSTELSIQDNVSPSISPTILLKQSVPQLTAVEILSWIVQFQSSDAVFCSGTKLWQYEKNIFGPGVSCRFIML